MVKDFLQDQLARLNKLQAFADDGHHFHGLRLSRMVWVRLTLSSHRMYRPDHDSGGVVNHAWVCAQADSFAHGWLCFLFKGWLTVRRAYSCRGGCRVKNHPGAE